MKRSWIVVAALVLSANAAQAQAPAAAPRAVGIGILHLNVANLQQSLTFYRDVLGMELTAPLAPPRAGGALVSEPGAMLQAAILKVPGGTFSMELVEWTGTPLRPNKPRIQDPGEIMLAMNVRDLDAKLAAARKAGFRVLTKHGVPFVNEGRGGRNRAVMIADPDGFITELVENATPPANAWPGSIQNLAVFVTARDLAQTVNFYNKVFGFDIMAPAAANPTTERVKALFNDPALATMRTARATFPGDFTITFQEFTGVDRKPVRHRVQDPGGPILLVNVSDFQAAVAAVTANGGTVGDGETSVMPAANATSAWVRDPNGVLIRLSPPAQPRRGGATQ